MKLSTLVTVLAVAGAASACSSDRNASTGSTKTYPPGARVFGFDQVPNGTLPAGWKIDATHAASSQASWMVQHDGEAPSGPNVLALTQPNHHAQDTFNLCWTKEVAFSDGTLEMVVRADGGEVDQGGGPIWRVQDANNYYICRFNPLEANFRVYTVKDGVRRQLATALTDMSSGKWHKVRVEQAGAHITCWLDGEKLLEADDSSHPAAGGIGVWTKADARTSFDEIVATPAGTK